MAPAKSASAFAMALLVGSGVAEVNQTRFKEVEKLCFPKAFRDIAVFEEIALSDSCTSSITETKREGVSPAWMEERLDGRLESIQRFNNASHCPNKDTFDTVCEENGKVCKYTINYGVEDIVAKMKRNRTSEVLEAYTVVGWELLIVARICAAKLCDMGEYMNSVMTRTHERHAASNYTPNADFEQSVDNYIRVGLEINCAAGGGVPAQAVRLGMQLKLSIADVTSSEKALQDFEDAFTRDVATALSVSKNLISFVEVRSVQPGSGGRRLAPAAVRVTFDILKPTDQSTTAKDLAAELVAQQQDATSRLMQGSTTGKADASVAMVQVTDGGSEATVTKDSFSSTAGLTGAPTGETSEISASTAWGPSCVASAAAAAAVALVS